MIDSSALLADLKGQLKLLQADLKQRADDPSSTWGIRLKQEYTEAFRRERTGWSWVDWRDNEVDQAAVAWIVSTTFLRFCEDNDLLAGAKIDGRLTAVGWIAGPGDRVQRAEENLTAYFRDNPTHNRRHWLQQGFGVLAAQPAGEALVDPKHNPVWTAEISPESATSLIAFWRRTNPDGTLVHDFTDPNLETRFLGDLYQDLSEHAKKTYALLQTPVFVEEFILDQTLTPAVTEFGLAGLKLIDRFIMRNFCVSRDIGYRARLRSLRATGARSASRGRARYSVASRYFLQATCSSLPASFKADRLQVSVVVGNAPR